MEFDERKQVDKEYKVVKMNRSQKAMGTRWRIIKKVVSLFHGYHANIEARPDSGSDPSMMVTTLMPCQFRTKQMARVALP